MTTDTLCSNLLLIQSPVHHPAFAPSLWLRVAKTVGPITEKLTLFDAGLDFYLKVLSDPSTVSETAASLSNKTLDSVPADLTGVLQGPGIDLINQLAEPEQCLAILAEGADRLRSDLFFKPSIARSDLALLDVVLALSSLAHHPCRFYRDGFGRPGLDSIETVNSLVEDQAANPFWQYAHKIWRPFASENIPELALLCVTSVGQTLAAATLVSAWHRRWPELRIGLCAPHGIAVHIERTFDNQHVQSSEKLDHLIRRAQSTFDRPIGSDGYPLNLSGAYLLPVQPNATDKSTSGIYRTPDPQLMTADTMTPTIDAASATGASLLVWDTPPGETAPIAKTLYAASRRGIWNHVLLPAQDDHPLVGFAKTNPNIIHSWCQRHAPLSELSDPDVRMPLQASTYGDTMPLPGQPVWMVLRDPIYIDAYVRHYGFKSVLRMRVIEAGDDAYEIGSRLVYRYCAPTELPEGYLDQIVQMIAAGGSVDLHFVRKNLERAHLIAYAEEQGVLIGNSCLKHPRQEYIEAVSQQIMVNLDGYLERGYTSVKPEYRGLGVGAKLLEGLTERAQDYKIFSVIAEGNTATQKMAIRNRTRRVATFFSHRTNKTIGIWIPEWMLPKDIELPPQPDLDQE